jgi:hypothetical protein
MGIIATWLGGSLVELPWHKSRKARSIHLRTNRSSELLDLGRHLPEPISPYQSNARLV